MPADRTPVGSTIDVAAFIDAQPVGAFQIKLILTCATVLFLDGSDTTAIGYGAPALAKEWNVSKAAPGGMLAAALIPQYGWRSVFVVGGAAPLILAPILALALVTIAIFVARPGRLGHRPAGRWRAVQPKMERGRSVRGGRARRALCGNGGLLDQPVGGAWRQRHRRA